MRAAGDDPKNSRTTVKHPWCSSPITVLAIAGVSLLVVWPTLIEQHWGLLDDGVMLAVARELQKSWDIPTSDVGRFFPAYFVYYALGYRFFGTETGGYYAVQALLIICTTLLLYAIVRKLTGSNGLGVLAALLFLTSSTIAENYYTVSKQEPRLILFLLSSLYCYIRADLAAQRSASQAIARGLPSCGALMWGIASAVSLMTAYLTKETTLMVLPASGLWVLGAFWLEKSGARRTRTRAATGYLGLNLVTFALFMVAAYVSTPTPLPWAGTYTGASLGLFPSVAMLRYYLNVNFDVLLLVSLALAGLLTWSLLQPPVLSVLASYAVFCLLCAAAYLALFVWLWKMPLAYYLLPVAAWAAIAISLWAKILVLDHSPSPVRSAVIFVLILALALSRFYSIPALYNAAVALKAWHKVNGQMVAWVSTLPVNSRVLLANVPGQHEYIFEAQLLLNLLYGRTDIAVAGGDNVEDSLQQARSGGFLLINFGAEGNRHVWVRAVQALPPLESSKQALLSATSRFRLQEAFRAESKETILPPFHLQVRSFVLGWVGYRVAMEVE
jgi:hypothetical protein